MALNMTLNTLWETSLLSDDPWWLYLVYGAGWTISLAVASFALALTLGTIVGTLRTVDNKWIRGICEGWIELFRNIPLIVQIFIWYFVVPELIPPYKDWMIEADPVLSQFLSAFLCMGLFTSSRIAEQVRAGITSLRSSLRRQGPGLHGHSALPLRHPSDGLPPRAAAAHKRSDEPHQEHGRGHDDRPAGTYDARQ